MVLFALAAAWVFLAGVGVLVAILKSATGIIDGKDGGRGASEEEMAAIAAVMRRHLKDGK